MSSAENEKDSLGLAVVAGASWVVVGSLTARVMGFLSILVLGRLLTPFDFGVFAVAMIAISFVNAVINRQFVLALIRIPEIERDHYDTAFTLSAMLGISAAIAVFFFAMAFAWIYPESESAKILIFLFVLPIIDNLRSTKIIQFERNINFVPETIIDLYSRILQVITSIFLALILDNYWALVCGIIVYSISSQILSYHFAPYLPNFTLGRWREFLSFGGWLTGAGVTGTFISMFDNMMVTVFLGTRAVGIYNMGMELVRVITETLAAALSRAVYPGLSAIQTDPDRTRRAYLKAQELMMAIVLPLGVGLAVTAPEALAIVLGNQWGDSAIVIQCLAPIAAVSTVTYLAQAALMAHDRTKEMFFRNSLVVLIQSPLILLGTWQIGFIGAIVGRGIGMLVHAYLSVLLAKAYVGAGVVDLLRITWRSSLSSLLMAVAVVLGGHIIGTNETWPGLVIGAIMKTALGICVYCMFHWIFWYVSGRPTGAETWLITMSKRILSKIF